MNDAVLYLLPNLLDSSSSEEDFLPSSVQKAVLLLNGLITESEKEARKFLRRFLPREVAFSLPLAVLNEHTLPHEINDLIKPLLRGEKWGVISDCGLPCLADPGAKLVFLANQHNIKVKTFAGPSSIVFSLMLSGFPAQRFSFHGYLPREKNFLQAKLSLLEKRSLEEDATQLWIEAPYRHTAMFNTALETLKDTTFLCVAENLSLPDEKVITLSIKEWKKRPLKEKEKKVSVFLLYAKK